MELMQSQHTDGSSGSLLRPDFLKASGAWEQQISLVCFRSVNLEFGVYASICEHITLAQSTNCKLWIGNGTMCGAELCSWSWRLLTGSLSIHNSEVLSLQKIQPSANSLDSDWLSSKQSRGTVDMQNVISMSFQFAISNSEKWKMEDPCQIS